MWLGVGGVDVEARDYVCSNCGAHFTSKAKNTKNARHKCPDGKPGTGKLLDRSNPPEEPLPEDEPFEPPKPKKESVEIVDGDAEFSLTGEEPQEESLETPEENSDLRSDAPAMAPVGDEPRKARKPHKKTPKKDATQIETLFKAMYAATGSVELTAEEEMEIVASLWAGVGEVHIDTGEVYVPAWMYIGTAGIMTALIMGRRQYAGMKAKRAVVAPPEPPKKKEQDISEGWGDAKQWQ